MDKKMIDALNGQVLVEFHAAYSYLAFSVALKAAGFEGMGTWFRKQYTEECEHAMMFVNYLESRGETPIIPTIQPDCICGKDPVKVFKKTLEMEKDVTAKINALMDVAVELKDYATQQMLFALVSEQIEEEASVCAILDKLNLAGDNGRALLHLDEKLGAR